MDRKRTINWARILAYITGTVDQELLVRNEYLVAENRILKAQLKGRLRLSDAERATLGEIGHRLGRKALEDVANAARPDTILGWFRRVGCEFVIIQEGETFPDDLYAGAIRVVVDGTLDGDLIAFAAEEIVINGVVTGSVTATSPKVTLNGEVTGSLRMTGNRLDVEGDVGGDVVAAVVSARLAQSSRVDGDVLLWAWDATALGSIGMDLTGTQRNLALAGSIDGDVDVSVDAVLALFADMLSLHFVDDAVLIQQMGHRLG